MTQSEMKNFFDWAEKNLRGFQAQDCDESEHYYLNDECIGGYAGDRRELFIKHNDELAKALRMMDAANAQ
ncbi:hypothetical protein ACOJUY_004352 [Vibrio alginolyticus]|uniref:hypothetical protein n=1 Tax=Vibrio diabolicus TaxID=50719 RepID=UPI00193DA1F1|nr:hypothetical protein [Vibrio diabolicus]EGQ8547893.1 hypothetical protein [Vibrio parahaemolyticus]EHA1078776.1 hypothetical protein [Vibrio alginolyticus]EGR3042420.1 hypothetical protein [Vibrio parahaemolyticus]EHA1137216.1 hypothetical protein [Vibrio alginolyticus]EJC6974834.1 hypothetical protein [Vibrio parahaemolyticus]